MIKNIIKLLSVFLLVSYCYSMDMNNPQVYLGLSSEVWDLDKPNPPSEEYEFFRHYLKQSKGPILEPMCGTGRYLIPFVEEGFNVDGFDGSKFMFNKLRKKCIQKNINPRIWYQFLEVVPEAKKYDLIFIPDTSFAIFTDLSHVKQCLQKIYALLLPGGKFVFDIQTIHSRWGVIGESTKKVYKTLNDNTIVEHSLPMPIKNSLSLLMLRYELLDQDGKIQKTEVEPYKIRLYKPYEMDGLLKSVGFKKIKRIKAHDHTAQPSLEDPTIVYECTK